MKEQSFSNHSRLVPGFHYVTLLLIIIIFVLSAINFFNVLGQSGWLYSGLIPLLISVVLGFVFFYMRQFPLKVQDRAIRAEENLRYFVLTGKRLDPQMTMAQIIALRFANDEEMPALAERVIKENLSGKEIKKAISVWRADNHRA